MILKVHFYAHEPILVPFNYLELLNGYVYSSLSEKNPDLFKLFHDNKLVVNGRPFKPFVFSNLFFEERQTFSSYGFLMQGRGTWYIASSDERFIKAMKESFKEKPFVVGNSVISVSRVENLHRKLSTDFSTLSPVAITAIEDGQRTMLTVDHKDFLPFVKKNLIKKVKYVHDVEVPTDGFELEVLSSKPDGILFDYKQRKIKGNMFTFRLHADDAYHELLQDTMTQLGIGVFNSMGCGFVLPTRKGGGRR